VVVAAAVGPEDVVTASSAVEAGVGEAVVSAATASSGAVGDAEEEVEAMGNSGVGAVEAADVVVRARHVVDRHEG